MKLIISEKPSLGRSIMTSIGEKFTKREEYYESENYYVVPLHGHILELKSFEEYRENKDKQMWSIANLPFFPREYEYKISRGNKKIFDTIKKLLKQENVTEIIHCGDADREGQIIVDLVLEKLNNSKPVTRPFIKSTTPEGLREAFAQRRPNEEYSNINSEGKTRAYIDFDFGINLSRYASRRSGTRTGLNVGRVIGAIVTEIYNRDLEIEHFVPREYFKVESDLEIKLTSKREFEADAKAEAENYAARLNAADAVVTEIKKARQTKRAPRLFSQTDLQGAANKRYGFSPKRTLKAAQNLYEKGLITYPRTNTNFMAEGDRKMVAGILSKLGPEFGMKPVFDDSKVDGHSAITPTGSYREVTGDEMKIYMMILNRFKAVFCKEPCTAMKTTVTIECIEEPRKVIEKFKVTGEVPITPGWKRYESVPEKTEILPDLNEGDNVEHDFKPTEARTKPPAHHTVTSLGKWMQNPFRKSDEDEIDYAKMLSGMEIGTEATRAAIIEKAILKDYIKLTKNTYTIQPGGRFLVEVCRDLGIDMSSVKTAEMGKNTKAVSRGEMSSEEVLVEVRKEISGIIGADDPGKRIGDPVPSRFACPECGKTLMESFNKLECGCGYRIWRTVAKKRLDDATIERMIKGEKTPLLNGFTSKNGRPFSAYLIPAGDGSGSVTFEFPPREEKAEKVPLGNCPKCGRPVYENKKGYGCSGWKPGGKGCDFVIWKYDRAAKKKISLEEAKEILHQKEESS